MKKTIRDEIRKELRKVMGHNITFKLLREFIETSGDSELMIMLVALTLGDPQVRDMPSWKTSCENFFRYYRDDILHYYRYDSVPAADGRMVVTDRELFIEQMARMKRAGVFEDCSFRQLAEILCRLFNTGYSLATLANKLQDAPVD